MGYCSTETWRLIELSNALTKGTIDKKKIVVPMFQRGKRWDRDPKKEEEFIDSLRKHYPIGNVLFFKTIQNGQEVYTLIDGLQRSTTIKKYLTQPTKFFKIEHLGEETLLRLYELLVTDNDQKVNTLLNDYITNLKSFSDCDIGDLFYNVFLKHYPNINNKWNEFNDILKPSIKSLMDEFNELCNIEIPALVYTGQESTLPDIFERINSKGVALNEYEIYAASWPKQRIKVRNQKIVEKVLEKYDYLDNSDYDLQDYDRKKFKNESTLTSFEYVFGLSKYICEKYEILNFYKNKEVDEANPVAFELLNACYNSAHKNIKDVYKIILANDTKIVELENAIIESIEFVNECISPITKFKGNSHSSSNKVFHSQFQILSYISFAFRKRYNSDLIERTDWKENQKRLKETIWKYYVYDILRKYWGEGGTGKIHSANAENRYMQELSLKQFSSALDDYNENLKFRHETTNVASPTPTDYVILNVVYLSNFTAMDQLSLSKFDVEHLVTKNQMKKLVKITRSEGLPISHIANLCYLPECANRSKGEYNLYQDKTYLETSKLTLNEVENKYSFTSKLDLSWMDNTYYDSDALILRDNYMEFLDKRYLIIKNKFLATLGFDVGDIDNKNYNEYFGGYTDSDFELTKIGLLIRNSFKILIDYNLLTNQDIEDMMDLDYSKNTLGCRLPMICDNISKVYDANGRNRYYKEPFVYRNKNYYLCSEWYEEARILIVPWLKLKMRIEDNTEEGEFVFL